MRSVIGVAVYLLFLGLFVFLLVEGAARLGILDTEIRSKRREIHALDGKPFVLLVGDSFSVDPPPGSFAELFRGYLDSRGITLVNAAKSGTGPRYYERLVRQFAGVAKPELIVVDYFAGNDLSDTGLRPRKQGLGAALKSAALRFYIFHYLEAVRNDRRTRSLLAEIEAGSDERPPELEGVSPFLIDLGNHHPGYFLENLLMRTERAASAWEENRGYLRGIAAEAEEAGAPLLLNIFPASLQVSRQHVPLMSSLGFELTEEFLVTEEPQAKMRAFCEEEGLACFDLLPGFRERSDQVLYLEKDTHWSTPGNRLAFELVRDHIEAAGLLPRR